MKTYYYLTKDGNLLCTEKKPPKGIKKQWSVFDNRASAWLIAVEAAALGAKPERIEELKTKWALTDTDAKVLCKKLSIQLLENSNGFVVYFVSEKNKQGRGKTLFDALVALVKKRKGLK